MPHAFLVYHLKIDKSLEQVVANIFRVCHQFLCLDDLKHSLQQRNLGRVTHPRVEDTEPLKTTLHHLQRLFTVLSGMVKTGRDKQVSLAAIPSEKLTVTHNVPIVRGISAFYYMRYYIARGYCSLHILPKYHTHTHTHTHTQLLRK